jgi:hypothetical protein
MDRRVNPRIKSGDGDDGSGWVNLIEICATSTLAAQCA